MNKIENLQSLIAIPSHSGKEIPIREHIGHVLSENGVESFQVNENLVVHFQGQDMSRAFIFNGHMDVVETGNPDRWLYNPWEGTHIDGRIYGRGSADMKSGLSSMIIVAENIANRNQKPPTDLWFAFVAREEVDGKGSTEFVKWFIDQGYLENYSDVASLFGEPTSLQKFGFANRGNIFLGAEIEGNTGHSSNPDAINVNSILQIASFISEVKKEHDEWQKIFHGSPLGTPSIAATSLEAISLSCNKIADHGRATFDLRTLPDFHDGAILKIKELAAQFGISINIVAPECPVGYTNPESKIVKTMKRLYPDIDQYVFEASTDLGFFTKHGIDGIIFGPGSMDQAHGIDEFVDVEQVEKAPEMFEEIYYAWAKNKE